MTKFDPDKYPTLARGLNLYQEAKRAQDELRWLDAAFLWRQWGGDQGETSAKACEMIHAANERGDRYRARVAQLQAGGASYDDALRQADREVYGR